MLWNYLINMKNKNVLFSQKLLELIDNLRSQFGTAIMLITHNLGIVARYVDRWMWCTLGGLWRRDPQMPYTVSRETLIRWDWYHPCHGWTCRENASYSLLGTYSYFITANDTSNNWQLQGNLADLFVLKIYDFIQPGPFPFAVSMFLPRQVRQCQISFLYRVYSLQIFHHHDCQLYP
jgi:energy-coupling factor transporter ATP-binding protein EcfA2